MHYGSGSVVPSRSAGFTNTGSPRPARPGQLDQMMADNIAGGADPAEINERVISEHLYTRHWPDPDLMIRTSGEMRISNFLLWQLAYAELHITDVLWPDFDQEALVAALLDYQGRQRRFGGVTSLP